jgi:6-phosphofructokinase 1
MSSGKILVAQGGGPTAVINQSLAGVVLEARRFRDVTLVYGALHGVRGIINEDLVSRAKPATTWNWWPPRLPRRWARPATSRTTPYCAEIFKVLQAHQIEQFYYIGGNDSSDTVRIVSEQARPQATRCAASTSQDHRQRPGRQ